VFGAYLLGLVFIFGWMPCIGPILAAIITYSAMSATPQMAALYLGVYSLGLAIPFLGAARALIFLKIK
jgi:cytochrome c-type biogenesis protein